MQSGNPESGPLQAPLNLDKANNNNSNTNNNVIMVFFPLSVFKSYMAYKEQQESGGRG